MLKIKYIQEIFSGGINAFMVLRHGSNKISCYSKKAMSIRAAHQTPFIAGMKMAMYRGDKE